MSFSGTTYTNVSGATTAVAGNIVQSAVWDNIHTDLATALTQVMSQLVAVVSFKNVLAANGSADVWQRGAGSSATFTVNASNTAYTADRWYITTGVNQQHTIAATTTLSNQSLLACKVQRVAGQTGVTAMVFGYPLDSDEVQRLRGNKVTLTGLIKAGANWSPASGTLIITLYVGTGGVAKRGGGFAGEANVVSISTNLTAGGAAVAISAQSSGTVPLTATQGEVQFSWTPVGTAGGDDSFTFDDIQLEANLSSTTWTPSQYDRIPFEMALQLCKRHYQKTFPYSVLPQQTGGLPGALSYVLNGPNTPNIFWQYPMEMRATAAITTYNVSAGNANWRDLAVGDVTATVDTANTNSPKAVLIYGVTATSTTTTGFSHLLYIQAQADAGI